MSTAVWCQDVIFAGGHRQPLSSAPTARSVDVSMETLASVWTRGAGDAAASNRHSSDPGSVWIDSLTPQLHRNQQLQQTLQQREEELLRLQIENNKLRRCLDSSLLRTLQAAATNLSADHRRKLKRSFLQDEDTNFQNLGTGRSVSKRLCRNLSATFCSETEPLAASEPNLDLWVLRTLGLKDRDTIDTSAESSSLAEYTPSSSSPEYSLMSCFDAAASSPDLPPALASSSSSSSEYSLKSGSLLSPLPNLHHSHQASHVYSSTGTAGHLDSDTDLLALSGPECSSAPAQRSEPSPSGPTALLGSTDTTTDSYHQKDQLQVPPQTLGAAIFPQPSEPTEASGLVHHQVEGLADLLYHSVLPQGSRLAPSQLTHSLPTPRHSPIATTSPVWTSKALRSPSSHRPSVMQPAGGAGQQPTPPQTPRCRTDVVFRMSLSPSSSVKTHSFPQGQAFVRKDTQGCWNFTWLPKQEP